MKEYQNISGCPLTSEAAFERAANSANSRQRTLMEENVNAHANRTLTQLSSSLSAHKIWTDYKTNPGNMDLRNRLVERYLPIVKHQAEKLHATLSESVDLEDVMMNGVFGLMDAIEKYDLARAVKFETYCVTRIRGAMIDGLRADDWVPRLARTSAKKLTHAREKFEQEHGFEPSRDALAALVGIDDAALNKLLADAHIVHQMSLDKETYETDSQRTVSLGATLADGSAPSASGDLEAEEGFSVLLQGLTPDEKIILTLYYQKDKKMKEIGVILGLSESRVSQMHAETLEHLHDRCRDHFGMGDHLDMMFRQHALWNDDGEVMIGDEDIDGAVGR